MSLVSIIIPMRNAEIYIKQTLESIYANKYSDIDIVVVNDGSTDQSLETVRSLSDDRLRVVNGRCNGIADAFNVGLDSAKGEILMRCDADDLFEVDRIQWQVSWLKKNPEYGAVCSGFSMIDDKGTTVGSMSKEQKSREITNELRQGRVLTHYCTYAVKTAILRNIGGCRQYFITAEDIDLQLRLGEATSVWYEDKISYNYRLHDLSITHTQQNNQRIFFENTAKFFQHQRLTGKQDDLEKGNPPNPPNEKDKPYSANTHLQSILIGYAWKIRNERQRGLAIKLGLKAFLKNPLNLKILKSLIALILKP